MKRIISFLETYKKENPIVDLLAVNPRVETLLVFKERTYKKMVSKKIRNIDLHQNISNFTECIDVNIIMRCDKYKSRFYDLCDRFGQTTLGFKPYYKFESTFNKYLTYGLNIIGENFNQVIVLYNDIPHSPIEYLIYFLSKELDIKIIYFQSLPRIDNHSTWIQFMTSGFEGEEYSVTLKGIAKNKTTNDEELISNLSPRFSSYLKSYSISDLDKNSILNIYPLANMTQINSSRSFGDNLKFYASKIYYLLSKGRILRLLSKAIVGFIINPIEKIYIKRVMLKYTKKIEDETLLEKKHIIYYPLHLQPEATSSPASNFFRNQLLLIKAISDNIDDNQLLIVKDHPATFSTSSFDQPERRNRYRNKAFYSSISKLKNTILVNSSISSKYLLSISDSVVTLRGSICLEALINKKSCLVFENSFYTGFPNTKYLRDLSNLKSEINSIKNKTISDNDILSTLSYFDSISFDYEETQNIGYENIIKLIEKSI